MNKEVQRHYDEVKKIADEPVVTVNLQETLLSAERQFDAAYERRWDTLKGMNTEELEEYHLALFSFLAQVNNSDLVYEDWRRDVANKPEIWEATTEKNKAQFIKKWLAATVASYLTTAALFMAEKRVPGFFAFVTSNLVFMGGIVVSAIGQFEPSYGEVFNKRIRLLDQFEDEIAAELERRKKTKTTV